MESIFSDPEIKAMWAAMPTVMNDNDRRKLRAQQLRIIADRCEELGDDVQARWHRERAEFWEMRERQFRNLRLSQCDEE